MTVLTPRIDAIEAGTSIAAASATVQGVVTTGLQIFAKVLTLKKESDTLEEELKQKQATIQGLLSIVAEEVNELKSKPKEPT